MYIDKDLLWAIIYILAILFLFLGVPRILSKMKQIADEYEQEINSSKKDDDKQ